MKTRGGGILLLVATVQGFLPRRLPRAGALAAADAVLPEADGERRATPASTVKGRSRQGDALASVPVVAALTGGALRLQRRSAPGAPLSEPLVRPARERNPPGLCRAQPLVPLKVPEAFRAGFCATQHLSGSMALPSVLLSLSPRWRTTGDLGAVRVDAVVMLRLSDRGPGAWADKAWLAATRPSRGEVTVAWQVGGVVSQARRERPCPGLVLLVPSIAASGGLAKPAGAWGAALIQPVVGVAVRPVDDAAGSLRVTAAVDEGAGCVTLRRDGRRG